LKWNLPKNKSLEFQFRFFTIPKSRTMARKKRKKNNSQHTRQQHRKHFNWFKRNIQRLLKLFECPEVFEVFDEATLLALYQMRSNYMPRLLVAKGTVINPETKKNIFSDFEYMMSEKKMKINDRINLSTKDILQYLAMIDVAVQSRRERCDLQTLLLLEKYREIVPDFETLLFRAKEDLQSILLILGVHMSRMNKSLCWLERIEGTPVDKYKRYTIEIREYIPKKQMMTIDKHRRPVYPLCYAIVDIGPNEISIPVKEIRLPIAIDKPEIPVFSQNHLLHRLSERLDCIQEHYSQFWLFLSLKSPKFRYFMGKILVEYYVGSRTKLGYIVLEFHKDRLLAKTFLLMSQLGTPEGEKLKEMCGMEKQDLNYWAIDKLSTFQKSDLKDHPKTRAIFEDAGCGDLFKELMIYGDTKTSGISQAKQFLQYLQGSNLNLELNPPDHILANAD